MLLFGITYNHGVTSLLLGNEGISTAAIPGSFFGLTALLIFVICAASGFTT